MKKRLLHLDARGSDGSDPARLLAVFDVLDDEGFTLRVAIPAGEAGPAEAEDRAIRAALAGLPAAGVVREVLVVEEG